MNSDPTPDAPKATSDFKVAEVREDGTAVLVMEDHRMFTAEVPPTITDLKKGATVTIKSDELDKYGVPTNAHIAKVHK